MPNQQLIEYIKQATEQGQSREQIKTTLLGAGWQEGDIEMAFGGNVASIPTPQPPTPVLTPSSPMQSSGGGQTVPMNTPQVIYGGFWIRYLALVLDSFVIVFTITFPIAIIVFLVNMTLGVFEKTSPGFSILFVIGMNLIGLILPYVYFIVLTNRRQATIGKRLLGLRVVSEDGARLSLGNIIIRETIGKIVSVLILGIGYFMVVFTSKKQGLHDKFAGSVVISNPAERKTWAVVVAIIAAILPIIIILGILVSVILVSLNSARAKSADASVRANLSNIRAGAEIVFDRNGGYGNMLSDSAVSNSLKAAEITAKTKAVTNVTETAYAIYLPLKKPTAPATGWCVDSTGVSKPSVGPGIATSCSPDEQEKRNEVQESSVLFEADNELIARAIKKYYENVKPGTIYTVSHKKVSTDGAVLEDFVYNLDVSTNKITPLKITKGVVGSAAFSMRYSEPIKTLEKALELKNLRTSLFGTYRINVAPFDYHYKINKDGIVTEVSTYLLTDLRIKYDFVNISNDFSRITIKKTEYDESGIKGQVTEEFYARK